MKKIFPFFALFYLTVAAAFANGITPAPFVNPAITAITGLGTGIATALGINVGSAGAPVLFNGAGGTPSSMIGTNITGTATGLVVATATAVASPLLTSVNNSVATNTALNNIGNYFDGASLSQGTAGTWDVACTVSVEDTAGAAIFFVKLWDGSTVIASTVAEATALGQYESISLSGTLATPAANIKISVRDISSTSGLILYNTTGNMKDTTCKGTRTN